MIDYAHSWFEQLRVVMIDYCNLGRDWQFNTKQKEALKQYYNANQLLVNCLNNACYTTSVVRAKIEQSLLLPTAEINLLSN